MQPVRAPDLSTLPNKVPQVTLFFWIIKILATTVGETADLLPVRLDLGLVTTSLVMRAVFAVALVCQLRAWTCLPPPCLNVTSPSMVALAQVTLSLRGLS